VLKYLGLSLGDRFLTNDFTAYNLTSWGINECKRDTENASFGGMLGKVLMRALPDHFSGEHATLFRRVFSINIAILSRLRIHTLPSYDVSYLGTRSS